MKKSQGRWYTPEQIGIIFVIVMFFVVVIILANIFAPHILKWILSLVGKTP